MNVREVMTRNPATVNLKASVHEVARVMRNKRIGSVIITEEGRLSGIITERDLVRKVLAGGRDPKDVKVTEIMSRPVISISEDEEILYASEVMKKNNIRRLVVVDSLKHIVGIITTNDMVRVMRRAIEELAITYYLMSEDVHVH